ncbi:MAG: TolB family protein [Lysobacterales bacterium]
MTIPYFWSRSGQNTFPIQQVPLRITLSVMALLWGGASQAQELVSVAGDGSQGNSFSQEASISDDGRYVAFQSSASNFALGDVAPTASFGVADSDIFVVDTQTGAIELISADPMGLPVNGSSDAEISADGRYVVFVSRASNLVANDTNEQSDVFFFDRETRIVQRVNLGPGGAQADGQSDGVAISADGTTVAFESTAANLVAGDTNSRRDIFVWRRDSGLIQRVSAAANGDEADNSSDQPTLSGNGQFVAFESNATNLVAGDTNERRDIFLVNLGANTIERVNLRPDGGETDANSEHPSISDDGRIIAFESRATNLTDDVLNGTNNIFVKDRVSGEVSLVSRSTSGISADAFCEWPSVSPDGQLVVFDCPANSLVSTDTGGVESVFLHDRTAGTTSLISTGVQDPSGNQGSNRPSMGRDAVAFASRATNLVVDDTNDAEDIFVVRFTVFSNGFESTQ